VAGGPENPADREGEADAAIDPDCDDDGAPEALASGPVDADGGAELGPVEGVTSAVAGAVATAVGDDATGVAAGDTAGVAPLALHACSASASTATSAGNVVRRRRRACVRTAVSARLHPGLPLGS